ncbi:glutamine transport ATP-binding protein GlnQ [Serratia sp. TKO39]|nr:glutamine transport ATP-binding protein GlnQ [Serratia sp. TKO39]
MTWLIAPHEVGFAEKGASRLIFIDKGGLAEGGTPPDLTTHPPAPRLQGFRRRVS